MEYPVGQFSENVAQFLEALEAMHPELSVRIEPGGADCWIDIGHAHGSFTVRWSSAAGFSLHAASEEAVFGEMPSEHYGETAPLLRRVEQLLAHGEVGRAGLRELREVRGLSQTELAARLGIQQAAISKVERRRDLRLDTLAAIVEAMGGTLEMTAKFPTGSVPLKVRS